MLKSKLNMFMMCSNKVITKLKYGNIRWEGMFPNILESVQTKYKLALTCEV